MARGPMLQNNQELYASVRELSRRLDDLASPELASELRAALSVSSLPGEVLGEIGLALGRLRGHRAYATPEVRRLVDEGAAYVKRALGSR